MTNLTGHWAKFDNTNFNTVQELSILSIDAYKQPNRRLSVDHIARTNKDKVASAFYGGKVIEVRVAITAPSREVVEQRVDTLMGFLQGIEKELWVPQSGGSRRFTATLSDVDVQVSGGAYWESILRFTCSDQFGYDTEYTTLLNMTGVTASTRADQYNFGGSADFQTPYISIFYTAVSGGNGSVIIGNSATGQQLTIAASFVAGSRLEVDCLNQTVKINGTEVAFTGAFPRFAKGTASLTYLDNFTSRTYNYFVYYYRRWV